MGFSSWIKNLFFEEKNVEKEEVNEVKEEVKDYDYNVKIFDVIKKEDINKVTSYIIQDKSLALIKMHKFTGNRDDLKEVLNELKTTCDSCNSKVLGITNNMYFITKEKINIEKDEVNSLL